MKITSRVLTISIVATALGACASTPQPCDLQQSLGACAVRVDYVDGKVVVCADEKPAQSSGVCKNAAVDVTTNKGYTSRKMLLLPGQCRSLGVGVQSAAQSSCEAFALSSHSAQDAGK
jgi:hypothetical protein